MRLKIAAAVTLIGIAGAMLLSVRYHSKAIVAGELPPGHGIQCLKADAQTPCGEEEIDSLKSDIAGFKQLVQVGKTVTGDTKTVVSDTKSAVGDAQQVGGDVKQVGSDAKALGSDAQNKDVKQGISDAQQTAGDAKTAKGDVSSAVGDVPQVGGDVKQVVKDLAGIKNISLKSPDGFMSCTQDDDSACNDSQTKALQTHAAQKNPPITVKRQADQPTS